MEGTLYFPLFKETCVIHRIVDEVAQLENHKEIEVHTKYAQTGVFFYFMAQFDITRQHRISSVVYYGYCILKQHKNIK